MGWTATLRCRADSAVRFPWLGLTAAALLGGVAPPLVAQRQIEPAAVIRGTLSFDGSATTGNFTGTSSTVTGELTGGASVVEVRGWVEAPVNTLVTGNDRRDRDLNKSMESDKFPNLRFELTGVRADSGEATDSANVMLLGDFTIHGVTRAVELPATLVFRADEIQVRSTFPMNLKDYQIRGLSKFLGVLKMDPAIAVHVDLVFGPK